MNSHLPFFGLISKQISSIFTAVPPNLNRSWQISLADGEAEIIDASGDIHFGKLNKLSLDHLILSSAFGQLVYGFLNQSWDQWAFFEGTSDLEPAGVWIAMFTRIQGILHVGVIEESRPLIQGHFFAIPHGFVDMGEQGHEAAMRELLEETGVKVTQIYSLGYLGHNTAFFGGSTSGAHSDEGFLVILENELQTVKIGVKESTLKWIPTSEFVLSGYCAPSTAVVAKALVKVTKETK